jgi:hypothetical protein
MMTKRMILWAALALTAGAATAGQAQLEAGRDRDALLPTESTEWLDHRARALPPRDWSKVGGTGVMAARAKAVLADLTENAKLVASDAAANDQFGYSVAVDGNTAVVGAWVNDQTAGADAGAVYVFLRNGASWAQQGAPIVPADVAENDTFGKSVAISGDTLVVGSPFATTAAGGMSGAAYVYVRNAGVWSLQQKLFDDDAGIGDGNDRFGFAVSVLGDTLIVGAPSDDTTTPTAISNCGAAHVYTRSAGVWTKQARLQASDRAQDDEFGNAVDLSSDQALVGAEYDDTTGGADAGSAYYFTRSAGVWTQQTRLGSSAGAATGLQFGHAVAIDGGTMAVSEHNRSGNAGAVQVFVGSGGVWNPQQLLTASDGESGDVFGHALDLRGDSILVGAYLAETTVGQVDRGTGYLFKRTGGVWAQTDRMFASDSGNGDRFGFGVALGAGVALLGAPLDDTAGGADAGSAYLFHLGTATTTTQNTTTVNITYNQTVNLNATVSGGTPTGTVEFRDGAIVLASIPLDGSFQANTVLTLPAGNYSIVAYYLGDANHLPSSSAVKLVNVVQATTTLQLQSSANPSVYGQNLTFTATLSVQAPGGGTPPGNIQFFDNGSLVAIRSLTAGVAEYQVDNLTHNLGVAHPITAVYSDTTNYIGSSAGPVNQIVNKATPTITLVSNPNPSFVGQNVALTATLTGGLAPSGTVTFFDGISLLGSNPVLSGVATRNTSALTLGAHNLQATYAGDDNHNDVQTAVPTVHNVVVSADVSVSKSNGVDFVQSGQETTYTIVVTNPDGGADVDGLRLNDVLDPAIFDDALATWACQPPNASACSPTSGTGSIIDLPLDLPAGSSVTITLTVPVLVDAELGVSNTVTLTMPSGVGDPNLDDNTATDTDGSGLFTDSFEDIPVASH